MLAETIINVAKPLFEIPKKSSERHYCIHLLQKVKLMSHGSFGF